MNLLKLISNHGYEPSDSSRLASGFKNLKFVPHFDYCNKQLLICCCLFFSLTGISQIQTEDSLKNNISAAKNDNQKITAFQEYAAYLVEQKTDDEKAFTFTNQSISLAQKSGNYAAIAAAQLIIADYYFFKSNWIKSIDAAQNALLQSNKINNKEEKNNIEFKSYSSIAESYAYGGDFIPALENRLKALSAIENTPDHYAEKGEIYVSVINDFRHLKQNSKAIEYINKAASIFDNMNSETKLNYYYEYYQNLLFYNKVEEASKMLEKFDAGLKQFPLSEQGRLDFTSMSYKLHGQFEMSYTKDFNAALNNFKGYLKYSLITKDRVHTGIALNKMGIALDSLHLYQEALTTFKSAFDTSMHAKSFDYAVKCADEMASIYQKTGDYKNATLYSNISTHLSDSLSNDEKLKELNFLEAKYQASNKEKQITALTLSNTEKELTVVKRNRILLIVGIIASALLLLLLLLYRNSKQKQIIAERDQKLKEDEIKFLQRQQQLVSLQSMVNGQETERTRIAKDLHDGLGGLFSTIKMYFSSLSHQQPHLKEVELFTKSAELVDSASTEVRRIAHNMMPEVLLKLGLINAMQDLCNNITSGKQLEVSFISNGMENRLNSSTEIMLYRIVQELLNNILKHARATKAIVQFIKDGNHLNVLVEDNGKGFNTAAVEQQSTAGLASIKSRVDYLNGELQMESDEGIGTTIMMNFLIKEG